MDQELIDCVLEPRVMATKEYPTLTRTPEMKTHHHRQFRVLPPLYRVQSVYSQLCQQGKESGLVSGPKHHYYQPRTPQQYLTRPPDFTGFLSQCMDIRLKCNLFI